MHFLVLLIVEQSLTRATCVFIFTRDTPAPLSLCLAEGYSQAKNTDACPPERNTLREIYLSAKGTEWTENENWMDEHISHCTWHGVECDPTNTSVLKLDLHNNGLSGKLSPKIKDLHSLQVLDLSDNDIKVCDVHAPHTLPLIAHCD